MDSRLLRIFQREVERQCRFGPIASEDMQRSLHSQDNDRLWYSIQALLVAAGNISKLLWPSKPCLPERARTLRTSLSVKDDSPLRPREFRNHFEHFDERLEGWARSSRRRTFVDSNVGLAGRVGGVREKDCLRNFEPGTWTLTFRGDTYHLAVLADAIGLLWQRATLEAGKPY